VLARVKPKTKKAAQPAREVVTAELVPVAPTGPGSAIALRHEPQSTARVRTLMAAFFAKRSRLTIRNYRLDLVHFGRWWRAGGPRYEGAGDRPIALPKIRLTSDEERDAFVAEVLREYHALDHMDGRVVAEWYQADLRNGSLGEPYAVQTANHRIAALKAVTDLAEALGLCSFDLSKVESLERERSRDTEGCGEDGFHALLAQAKKEVREAGNPVEKFRALRTEVLLRFMYDCGMRRFEGLQIRWPEHVDLKKGRLFFRRKKRKEGTWIEALNDEGIATIKTYLVQRGNRPGYLVYGRYIDRPMDVSAVNRSIAGLSKRAKIAVTPHGLRHTAATVLLDKTDGNVRSVAEFLGHRGLGTVQEYDDARKKLPKQMGALLAKRGKARRRKATRRR
jgi:integrase